MGTLSYHQMGYTGATIRKERNKRMRKKVKKGTSVVFTETEGLH